MEELHSNLLVFEHQLKQQEKDEEHQTFQANVTQMSCISLNTGGRGSNGEKQNYKGSKGPHSTQNYDQFSSFSRGRGQSIDYGKGVQFEFYEKNGLVASNCYELQNIRKGNFGATTYAYVANNTSGSSNNDTAWILYIGAIHHITHDYSNLSNPNPYPGTDGVIVGNGVSIPIFNFGRANLTFFDNTLSLNNVLHTPQVNTNLVSIHKLYEDNDIFIEFHSHSFLIRTIL